MSFTLPCSQKDLFGVPMASTSVPVVLEIKGIPVPASKSKSENPRPHPPNYHIPSFKNQKMWLTKSPQGKPLKRPFLITKPEYQQWMEQAVQSLELQLLSMCQEGEGIPPECSKLFAILSLIPEDDSWRDYPEGNWKVEEVPYGKEGCRIVIERIG